MMRMPWSATSEAESRGYLQARLAVLIKSLFWAFVALLGFLEVMYRTYPTYEPRYDVWVFVIGAASLVVMAIMWRAMLVRRQLSFATLHGIDLVFTIGSGCVFAAAAAIAYDRRVSGYTCLMYLCFTLLTRALIVPSTGKRTAVASALAFVPLTAAACWLAWRTDQGIPGPAVVAGYLVVVVVTVLLAAAGSRIIYNLRHRADAAQQLGQYRLVRKIGEGGFGEVYLANHVMLRRPTAVKRLFADRVGAEMLARFEREVHSTSQLTHPNTVAVYDYGHSPGGVFYYAMEYLGGGVDLQQLVERHGAQPPERVVPILIQVCGALQEAHDSGIVHHDIKPANIMLCERGGMPDVAKVVDFGLVKKITADDGESQQVILGTPAYLAPEAIRDPASVGPASDLYALGCVAYFLLAGRKVFDGKTAIDTCMQQVSATPAPLGAAIPEPLAAIVMSCLAKSPADRPASATKLAEALAAIPLSAFDAKTWWRELGPREDVAASSFSTLTIPIDLGERA